jgi:RNA polymerase sigma-70 factor (ECF subfamily)
VSRDFDENEQLQRLLAQVALGDRVAFRGLYDATSAKLFGFAIRILKKHELAEEALQDAFVSIWHAASSYQVHLSAPMTWLATIVRNKALDIRRRLPANMEIEFGPGDYDPVEALQETAAGPEEQAQLSRDALALAGCMERLAAAQRQVIGMAYLHDLSHSEVAAQLSLPLGTVKTWIRRGLERLRACLTKGERT